MRSKVNKVLLVCGIVSSALYIGTDILASMPYPGYSYTAQQVSELSAIGAPTRPLWITIEIILAAGGRLPSLSSPSRTN